MEGRSVCLPVLGVGVLSLSFAGAMIGCLAANRSAPEVVRTPVVAALAEHGDRRPVALLVHEAPDKASSPLRVSSVDAEVVVSAGVATTTLDITFRNDLDRVLEGELVLPLPRGASVSSFALEVNGKLRPASVVERDKARIAFEEVVRRGVDPGLVEWTRGNVFRTRVYPIPARGTKRLVLAYDEELVPGASGRAGYRLPLAFGGALETFALSVKVIGLAPTLGATSLPLVCSLQGGETWVGKSAARDVAPRDLLLELDAPAKPEATIEAARMTPGDGLVFLAPVPVPALEARSPKPRRITILDDASSANARDLAKERAFLEALLEEIGEGSVRVVIFSNEIWETGELRFDVRNGRAEQLLERIASIRPDGGARLSCLDLRRYEQDSDRILLLSAGLSNLGRGEATPGSRPVSCVTSARRKDMDALQRIARDQAVVDLLEVEPREAVRRALETPLAFDGFDADPRVSLVYPAAPSRVDGPCFTLAGRVRGDGPAKLALRFRRGSDTASAEVVLDPSLLGTTGRLERLWAQKRIANLLLDSRTNEGEIVRFAKAHGIVTPFTSLLVLETLQDYVRYRVSPPEELAEAWAKAIQVADAQTVKTRDEKLVSLGWRRPLDAAAIEAKRKQEQELSERIAREHAARRDSSTEELAIERKKALIQKLIRDGVELLDQEKYDQAEVTFGDILERDPGNDQAIKFREIAREGRHLKAASTNHKDRVSDEYLEDLNEITVASPEVPDGRTVTFPDKDFWVNKVLRREAGTDGAAPLVVSANRQRSAPVATDAATEAKRMRDQELADRVAREERALGDASTQEQQAIERRKAQIQRFIRDGVELLDQEKYEEAEAMFADILERDPENGQAMELREIAREGRHLRTSSANQKDGEGVLRALSSSATDDQLYAAYLDEKAFHGSEPAFYLDSADVFFARNLRTLGLRVLTNLAGLEVESAPLMRLLAYRLKEAGELDLAIAAFEEVARLRPEEPQSFRDLALAQADAGDLASAVANLEKVVLGTWDGRFPGIEHIALGELGQLVARAGAKPLPTLTLPRELVTHAELDLRVVLTWDADATDVDLWVTEPSGEKAMYNHKNTASGGIFGNDFTRGYGPEEYRLAKAPSGRFKVQVNSFGDSRQTERTPISVHVSVFRNYGRPDETRQDFTRRLGHESEVLDVAEIEVR